MVKSSKNGKYPVRKGSRLDRLSCDWIFNRIIAAIEDLEESIGDNARRENEMVAVGRMNRETIEQFSRIIIYTDHDKSQSLTTMNGNDFIIPKRECSDEELVAAYRCWLDTDEDITNPIDADIRAMNAAPTPPWMTEPENVTEEQRADPNS